MRVALAVLIGLVLAGCAAGSVMVRPQADSLQLGTTTYDQVLQRYGDPRRTGTQVRNGETLKTVSYAYAVGTPFVDDVPARASGCYFLNGVLVGYEYLSSFREDKTDFDETKVQQIKKGETTRWRVIELFGQPRGMYMYPLITQKGDLALVYLFNDNTRTPFVPGSLRVRRKQLIVSIGTDGTVTDVVYTESSPK